MAKLNIDGREYDTDNLPEDVKAQVTNVQIVDRKIGQLKQDLAILETARNAYVRALQGALPKAELQQ
ncbi:MULTISPECIES: DUF6447 family protein [unclassified Sulfitobacter]|uniref:DUF6447 family protein n=1 Tax=unclassified Sulfitobacter TaxID=196795 RepID=UPI00374650E9